jgi:hypothetical protein
MFGAAFSSTMRYGLDRRWRARDDRRHQMVGLVEKELLRDVGADLAARRVVPAVASRRSPPSISRREAGRRAGSSSAAVWRP